MTSPHYQFNDLNEFYLGQNWALAAPACFLFSFEDIPFLLTETEIIDKTPNDWEEWKGDKDEEHIPEFIEDLGFKELGKTGYYWIEEQVDKTAAECLRKRVAELEQAVWDRINATAADCILCGCYHTENDPCGTNCARDDEEEQYEISLDGCEEVIPFSSKEEMKETFDRFVKEMEKFGEIRYQPLERPTTIDCYGDDEVENWCWDKNTIESDSSD